MDKYKCRYKILMLALMFSILISVAFLSSNVIAARTASLSISHTNTSPAVNELDTIRAYVSWSEMNGMDGYMISLIIPKTVFIVDYYDSPYIVDVYGVAWRFNWFWGYIDDSGSNNLCYVKVKYAASGIFTTTLEFTVYIEYGYFWIPVQTWQTSKSWYVSTSSMMLLSTPISLITNNTLKIISYKNIFNETTIPKIVKFLETLKEYNEFKETYSESFSIIFGVTLDWHKITALLIGHDNSGNKVYEYLYIPMEVLNAQTDEIIVK
ncbi:MAG: hypothetical protein ACTSSP_08315 [Candidatus Asgardarchaeia archaeon]